MHRSVVAGVVILLGTTRLPAQSPAPVRELRDALPADATMEFVAMTEDSARTYFQNSTGEIWMYDRARKTPTRLVAGSAWDLNLSPARNALAYTRAGEQSKDQYVWVLPLDPRTGLAAASERRLSANAGDVPSISPDGRLVAFARDDSTGVGQSIVVIAISGGAERVVAAALPSSVANIRWTPDGTTLYFGVNPPVECVPQWSCLPLAAPYRQPAGTIRRVAVSGGPVSVVATAKGLWPGLSPDGRTLAYLDTGRVRRWVVADADGRRRDTFILNPNQAALGWLRGSTVLVASGGRVRRLRSMTLSGQQSHVLLETTDPIFEPLWSPDGNAIALVARAAGKGELRILSADGSPQQSVRLPEPAADGMAWSPDRRWIAYTGYVADGPPHISAVELATGKVVLLYTLASEETAVTRWRADSRGVVVSEIYRGSDADRRVVFRLLTLDGTATILREVALGEMPSVGVAIDEHRALLVRSRPHEYRVLALTGDSTEKTILPEQAGFASGAVFSSDGSWIAVRRNPRAATNAQMDVIDLLHTDGSSRATIHLPFFAAPGPFMQIVRGGRELVVAENRRPDRDPGVFLVTAATQSVEKLFSYAVRNGSPPELAVSPVDRTVLSLGWESLPPSVFTLDLAPQRNSDNR
jgi:Tol biopolymer transport system component